VAKRFAFLVIVVEEVDAAEVGMGAMVFVGL
jgi:hypothetical protein